jgi:VIT1/CCC1 family predicted Fe2+/Mn2+ transporter
VAGVAGAGAGVLVLLLPLTVGLVGLATVIALVAAVCALLVATTNLSRSPRLEPEQPADLKSYRPR